MPRILSLTVVIASALAAPLAARAAVVVQFENGEGTSTFTSEGKRLRMQGGGEKPHVVIFDGEAQKMVQLDPAEKKYTEFTQADAKAMHAQLEQMMAQLPPERRAMVEGRMKQQQARPAPTYEATGKTQNVAGYTCQGYRVVREGKVHEEECLIPWSASPVKKDDLQGLLEFGKFLETFAATMGGRDAAGGASRGIVEQITRAPGFPAVIERVDANGKRELQDRLVSVKHASAPADAFTIPAGYAPGEKGLGAGAKPGHGH